MITWTRIVRLQIFWYTYYSYYRSSNGSFIFPIAPNVVQLSYLGKHRTWNFKNFQGFTKFSGSVRKPRAPGHTRGGGRSGGGAVFLVLLAGLQLFQLQRPGDGKSLSALLWREQLVRHWKQLLRTLSGYMLLAINTIDFTHITNLGSVSQRFFGNKI